VIPGIFVSLCLRFDFIKALDTKKLDKLIEKDKNPMRYLLETAINCEKSYFKAVNVGYLLAMVCTIVVMLVFDHGQPALLYLVPGCCLSVLGTALAKGEYKKLMEHDENDYITPEDDEEDDDKKEKK
jgi:minor histocompatibility antigen H13